MTSQCCNACGTVDAASHISRSRFCINCGNTFDANVNASKISRSTGGHPGMACDSGRTTGRKQEQDAYEGGSSALQAASSHKCILNGASLAATINTIHAH